MSVTLRGAVGTPITTHRQLGTRFFMAVNASGHTRTASQRPGVPAAVYNIRHSCLTIGLSVVALLVLFFALILI
ncbi:hypothetical protein [Gordonia aichiensis]